MQIFLETERLLFREIMPEDEHDMFRLDNDPRVHIYLQMQVHTLEESRKYIAIVREQYVTNGIGRWAAIEKETGAFIGWAGLKLVQETYNDHCNFYDIGYRLIPEYWGKGYATEATLAILEHGFRKMRIPVIYGMVDTGNIASQRVLEKAGLQYKEQFDFKGDPALWYELTNPYL